MQFLGSDLIRQGWSRRSSNALQEGYGSAAVLPEQGIYLTASVYRPVLQVVDWNHLGYYEFKSLLLNFSWMQCSVQFTDKVASMLPQKYSQLGYV